MKTRPELITRSGKSNVLKNLFTNLRENDLHYENTKITQCVFLGVLKLKPVPSVFSSNQLSSSKSSAVGDNSKKVKKHSIRTINKLYSKSNINKVISGKISKKNPDKIKAFVKKVPPKKSHIIKVKFKMNKKNSSLEGNILNVPDSITNLADTQNQSTTNTISTNLQYNPFHNLFQKLKGKKQNCDDTLFRNEEESVSITNIHSKISHFTNESPDRIKELFAENNPTDNIVIVDRDLSPVKQKERSSPRFRRVSIMEGNKSKKYKEKPNSSKSLMPKAIKDYSNHKHDIIVIDDNTNTSEEVSLEDDIICLGELTTEKKILSTFQKTPMLDCIEIIDQSNGHFNKESVSNIIVNQNQELTNIVDSPINCQEKNDDVIVISTMISESPQEQISPKLSSSLQESACEITSFDEKSKQKTKPKRSRLLPAPIPSIFLQTPRLLRSELSQKNVKKDYDKPSRLKSAKLLKPNVTKVHHSEKHDEITCTKNVNKSPSNISKNSPSSKKYKNQAVSDSILKEDTIFVSEEIKSPNQEGKPSLKLIIRQKKKIDITPTKTHQVDLEENDITKSSGSLVSNNVQMSSNKSRNYPKKLFDLDETSSKKSPKQRKGKKEVVNVTVIKKNDECSTNLTEDNDSKSVQKLIQDLTDDNVFEIPLDINKKNPTNNSGISSLSSSEQDNIQIVMDVDSVSQLDENKSISSTSNITSDTIHLTNDDDQKFFESPRLLRSNKSKDSPQINRFGDIENSKSKFTPEDIGSKIIDKSDDINITKPHNADNNLPIPDKNKSFDRELPNTLKDTDSARINNTVNEQKEEFIAIHAKERITFSIDNKATQTEDTYLQLSSPRLLRSNNKTSSDISTEDITQCNNHKTEEKQNQELRSSEHKQKIAEVTTSFEKIVLSPKACNSDNNSSLKLIKNTSPKKLKSPAILSDSTSVSARNIEKYEQLQNPRLLRSNNKTKLINKDTVIREILEDELQTIESSVDIELNKSEMHQFVENKEELACKPEENSLKKGQDQITLNETIKMSTETCNTDHENIVNYTTGQLVCEKNESHVTKNDSASEIIEENEAVDIEALSTKKGIIKSQVLYQIKTSNINEDKDIAQNINDNEIVIKRPKNRSCRSLRSRTSNEVLKSKTIENSTSSLKNKTKNSKQKEIKLSTVRSNKKNTEKAEKELGIIQHNENNLSDKNIDETVLIKNSLNDSAVPGKILKTTKKGVKQRKSTWNKKLTVIYKTKKKSTKNTKPNINLEDKGSEEKSPPLKTTKHSETEIEQKSNYLKKNTKRMPKVISTKLVNRKLIKKHDSVKRSEISKYFGKSVDSLKKKISEGTSMDFEKMILKQKDNAIETELEKIDNNEIKTSNRNSTDMVKSSKRNLRRSRKVPNIAENCVQNTINKNELSNQNMAAQIKPSLLKEEQTGDRNSIQNKPLLELSRISQENSCAQKQVTKASKNIKKKIISLENLHQDSSPKQESSDFQAQNIAVPSKKLKKKDTEQSKQSVKKNENSKKKKKNVKILSKISKKNKLKKKRSDHLESLQIAEIVNSIQAIEISEEKKDDNVADTTPKNTEDSSVGHVDNPNANDTSWIDLGPQPKKRRGRPKKLDDKKLEKSSEGKSMKQKHNKVSITQLKTPMKNKLYEELPKKNKKIKSESNESTIVEKDNIEMINPTKSKDINSQKDDKSITNKEPEIPIQTDSKQCDISQTNDKSWIDLSPPHKKQRGRPKKVGAQKSEKKSENLSLKRNHNQMSVTQLKTPAKNKIYEEVPKKIRKLPASTPKSNEPSSTILESIESVIARNCYSKKDTTVFDFDEDESEEPIQLQFKTKQTKDDKMKKEPSLLQTKNSKTVLENKNNTPQKTSPLKSPMKQTTIMEMFEKITKEQKQNLAKPLFETSEQVETVNNSKSSEACEAETTKNSSKKGPQMPPPPSRQTRNEEYDEDDDFSDDDSRAEWIPEEYAEYKFKYSAKKLKPQIFRCKICLMTFPSYPKLLKHKDIHVKAANPYECKLCKETFKAVDELVAHLKIHKGEHPYKCNKCNEGFWKKEDYDKHLPIHILRKVKEAPKKYQCDLCGKAFVKLCDMDRHTRVHTGEKPSICNICGKGFQQSHNLSKHLITHLHIKPFTCEICNKQFNRPDVLSRHVLTHAIEKPFKCSLCSKSFIRQIQLNMHIKHEHTNKTDEKKSNTVNKERSMLIKNDETEKKRSRKKNETK